MALGTDAADDSCQTLASGRPKPSNTVASTRHGSNDPAPGALLTSTNRSMVRAVSM